MEYAKIKLSKLVQNDGQIEGLPKNPRQWTKEDVEKLKASIEETPELLEARGCIVYPWNSKYIVLGGNMRLTACRQLGHKEMPCVVLDADTSVEKLKEIVIKDNGSFGAWDFDMLANEWDDLPLCDWGVPAWEMSEAEEEKKEAVEDDFDEDKAHIEARCSRGDIWQLGDHRLMCGDSAELEDVKKLMGGGLADLVFTDPPYGVAIGDKNKMLNSVQKAGRCCTNIIGDTLTADELFPILVSAMTNCRLSCKDDASYYVTAPQGGELGLLMMMMMKEAGLQVRHNLIWLKNSPTFSMGRLDYDYQHEPIMYTWTKSHHNYRKGKYRTSVWPFDKPRKCDLHPTMKPVELVANCILDSTKERDVVLDVFGGSGTTLIAAAQLGRSARIMELDPHYCDVIIARWENLTGEIAIKIS